MSIHGQSVKARRSAQKYYEAHRLRELTKHMQICVLSKSIYQYEARYGLVNYHTGAEAVRFVRYFRSYRQAREYLETIPTHLYNYSVIIRRYNNGN